MTTISDPSAMTPDDPRWLSWFMQQRRFDRLSRKAQTGASLITDFASGVYEMGYPGQRRGNYELSDLITFSRASGGGRFNSSGVYERVGNNVPRLTYDPVTLQPLGLLVEEQRTNLLLQSAVLSTQNVTVTAVAHTLSFYGTGTVTLSGVATGSKTGTGAYPALSTLTFTPTAGTLTLTVTGSVTFGQLEAGATATSYIPTEASQVTRAADVATVNTLAPWYNASKGTLVVTVDCGPGSSALPCAVALTDGTNNNYMYFLMRNATNAYRAMTVRSGNAEVAALNPGPVAFGRIKCAGSYEENSFSASFNGGVPATDALGPVPVVTQLSIGRLGSSNHFNGIIKDITYYARVIDVQQASA